jgi:hypothetical protein
MQAHNKGSYQGKEIVSQDFNYTPSNMLVAKQDSASTKYSECKDSFAGVDKVEFTTDNPTVDIVILDDITYTRHTCT